MARVRRWHDWLDRRRAPIADSLERFDAGVAQALHRLLRSGRIRTFGDGHERIWDIVPDQRVLLDFHKNQILHYLAPAGLATLAIRALGRDSFTRDELVPGFESASRWLRREFVLDPDLSHERILDGALSDLIDHGALVQHDGVFSVASIDRIGEVHGLMRSHAEAYRVVAAFLPRLDGRRVDAKATLKEVLATRDAALAAGLASRPESFGAVTLGNAIQVMIEEGALHKEQDGKLVVNVARAAECAAVLTAMVDG
jgi:glycerol-3-phosphate O-acyltransferase